MPDGKKLSVNGMMNDKPRVYPNDVRLLKKARLLNQIRTFLIVHGHTHRSAVGRTGSTDGGGTDSRRPNDRCFNMQLCKPDPIEARNSPRAIEASVYVVRAFVRLREVLASNQELAAKLDQLEKKLSSHDQAIVGILEAIRQLMRPPAATSRPIGFVTPKDSKNKPQARAAKRL